MFIQSKHFFVVKVCFLPQKCNWLFGFLLLAFSVCLNAHPEAVKSDQPIQIQSDVASYEQLNHLAIHQGNVVLTQNERELRADKLTIQLTPQGRAQVITATGNPAKFSGKMKENVQPLYATAKTIYYYPEKQLVVLEGAATLMQDKDTFHGPSLSYQLDKQIITAAKQSDERPTLIIHPKAHQK